MHSFHTTSECYGLSALGDLQGFGFQSMKYVGVGLYCVIGTKLVCSTDRVVT